MDNIYCKYLLNSLSFHQDNVRFCTTLQLGELISKYEEKPKELAQKIINLRNKIKENIKNDVIPAGCKDCIYRLNEYCANDKINKIDLYYWYHCNCGCFYCSYRDKTQGEFSDKIKEGNPLIYKTIKELYKYDVIDKQNLIINVGGGELGVLKEFSKLINLFIKNNVNMVYCESSGIRYSKAVENLLKKGKGHITVAVCTGSREVYKQIKKRDKYNQVMKNLNRYLKAASKFKSDIYNCDNVVSKLIILKGFNDKLEEVENWLLESKKCGLTQVELSMEFCWGTKTKSGQKIEDYNYEIFEYVKKRCVELGLKLKPNITSIALMENGFY